MTARARVLLAALVLLAILPAVLSACPLCKDALEDPSSGVPNQLGRGFYYSILLMVSAPFVVVGALFLKISRRRRRQPAGGAAAAPAAAVPGLSADPRGART
jgi:hypothetical protein